MRVASCPTAGTFVGIDWGGSHHQVCLLDPTGELLGQRRLAHDRDGFAVLDRVLSAAPAPVRVALERAEGLLVEHLQDLGIGDVYPVSPRVSARARERYRLAPVKSDSFDAFVLADTLRHEYRHWRPLRRPSRLLAELRAVSRDRERLVGAQRSVESQLRAVLDAYHPAPLHLFSALDRDIALAFVRDYPTPARASRVGTERMAAFCGRHGYSGRTTPRCSLGGCARICWPGARAPRRGRRSPRGCSSTSWSCSTPSCAGTASG